MPRLKSGGFCMEGYIVYTAATEIKQAKRLAFA